jgi:hypothetical protein
MEALVSGAVKRYSCKRRRKRHGDRLRCSPFEADLRDDVIRFVDGHIFNHQAHHAFALAHRRLGVIPELAEAFWDPIYLGTFFRAHLMLIALVVALFDSSRLF